MRLLERESQLRELHAACGEAAGGRGRTVLVSGEAGIGKTSLVRQFADEVEHDARARVLHGACEALFTPRPLGPFYDVAHAIGGALRDRLDDEAKPVDLFHALLESIRRHDAPSVIVLEDMHWADHGTLDFVRFLARRIDRLPGLLVLTYRDDETGADHPLTQVLGELPASGKAWIRLPALSRATVEELALEAGREPTALFRTTAGNPFFVSEALREDADRVAPSVREAVLARAGRLSEPARKVLDVAAMVPDRIEIDLLEQTGLVDADALDECIVRGFLRVDAGHVAFRHEIARLAVAEALPPLRRRRTNARILEVLTAKGDMDPSALTRLAHHAIAADDAAAIARHAPPAATAASRRGAHREAALLLDAVLPFADTLPLPDRARYFDQRARACLLVARGLEAVAMGRAAQVAWHAAGDAIEEGRSLVRLCELLWMVRPPDMRSVEALGAQALDLLRSFGASDALSLADWWHRLPASLDDNAAAQASRERALQLVDSTTNPQARISALNGVTTLEYVTHGVPDRTSVERLEAEAEASADDHGRMLARARRGWLAYRNRELAVLEAHVAEGRTFARDRQLEQFISSHALDQFEAECAMARGRWAEAERLLDAIGRRTTLPWFFQLPYCRMPAAVIRARQGRDFDPSCLDRDFEREQRLVRMEIQLVHRGIVEIAWLTGDAVRADAAARSQLEIARTWQHGWSLGEAITWARLVNVEAPAPTDLPLPYRLQLSGDVHGAARAWRELGYVYEAGLALLLGDDGAMREAVRTFEELGAPATAERARERLRASGAKNIPQGPRASTRANPAGLTEREAEILGLVARGLANADIAARLHRSVRTVEHHVTALIDKLGAGNRLQAVAIARARGFLDDC